MLRAHAFLLALALALAASAPRTLAAQLPPDTIVQQTAFDGCVRIHHLWKPQLAIDHRTQGDSAARADALLREVFHPYREFWDRTVGGSELSFLQTTDVRRRLVYMNPSSGLQHLRDPGARIIEATQRIATLTRQPTPCTVWYVAFAAGINIQQPDQWSGVDLTAMIHQPDGDALEEHIRQNITRRTFRHSRRADPDSGRLITTVLEEGIAGYVSLIDRGRGTSMREVLGSDENALHWTIKNEKLLWDAAKPQLRSRSLSLASFESAGVLNVPGLGRPERILGYRIIEQYVARHGADSWRDFFTKPAAALLEASGYDERLAADSTTFRITTNEFWLNLHHFLYVLGRAQNNEPDAARDAVAQAPVDAERVLARLDSADQATWRAAVTAYAENVSRRDAVFDLQFTLVTNALKGADATTYPPYHGPNMDVAEALRRAAPIYRDGWWPEHHVANRRWADSIRTLLDTHGDAMLAYIRRAYRLPWPSSGFPVRVVAYANWAGAYSTRRELLVISSLAPGLQGMHGLETSFHEAMHQWDDSLLTIIGTHANRLGVSAPVDLAHQLIFFTAGEAARHALPGHVPYAERYGLWKRLGPGVQPVLAELWKPYLEGRGDRDAVIGEIVRRIAPPR
jgi:hypothetical protein